MSLISDVDKAAKKWKASREYLQDVDPGASEALRSEFSDADERARVFQIDDPEQRKKVIAAFRNVEENYLAYEKLRLQKSEADLVCAEKNQPTTNLEQRLLFGYVTSLLVLSFFVGIEVLSLYGFLGLAWLIVTLRRSDRKFAGELDSLRAKVIEQRDSLSALSGQPSLFSAGEAESGVPAANP